MKTIFFIVVLLSVALGCKEKPTETTNVQDTTHTNTVTLSDDQYRSLNIKLARTERKPVPSTIQVNGVLDVPPQNLVTISAPIGGFVKSTPLLQGMKIKKGEVIGTLEHQDYIQLQQEYLDNASKLEYLQAEYHRQQELAKENVNSQKTYQQAKSNFESAKAAVEGLQARLKMLSLNPSNIARNGIQSQIQLYAPVSGYVTEVNVNIGAFVASTDVMFRIVNLEHLHAELQVYEKDIHNIKPGQKVNFHLANEMSPRTASVYLVGKEISADRTVRVHCHLDKEDETLLPGMYVTATIETSSQEGDVIPSTAIVTFEGQQAVFVKRARRQFELITIRTGNTSGNSIIIESGSNLQTGDSIVTEGSFQLLGMLKNAGEEDE